MARQVIECVDDYPICGFIIKKGTILTENSGSKKGSTVFSSKDGYDFHFDNSEILFSPVFHKSFKLLKKI